MVCLNRSFQPWLIKWGWALRGGEAGILAVSQTGTLAPEGDSGARIRAQQQKK